MKKPLIDRTAMLGLLLIALALLPIEKLAGLIGGGYSGPIAAVVVYESADSPSYTRDQMAAMGSTAVAEFMTGKGYTWLPRVDDDSIPPRGGTLPPVVTTALTEAAGKPFPRIVILDPATAKVLASETIVDEATTLALLRKWGGS